MRWSTLRSIDEKSESILGGLHAKPWRLLHLAGHGAHEFEIAADSLPVAAAIADGAATPAAPRALSGMVIGRNTFLTPGDVEQMRYVPELVFINCCYLGKTQGRDATRYNALAAATWPLGGFIGPPLAGALLGGAMPVSWVGVIVVGMLVTAVAAAVLGARLPPAVERPAG